MDLQQQAGQRNGRYWRGRDGPIQLWSICLLLTSHSRQSQSTSCPVENAIQWLRPEAMCKAGIGDNTVHASIEV